MIELNRRTRRVQSSKSIHPAQSTYSNAYQGYHHRAVNILQDLMRNDTFIFLNPVAIILVALETQNDDAYFQSEQKKLWDVSAAGLEKWLHVTQAASQDVTDRMMELAGIKPGYNVLDIATGIGDPAIDAARIVQPTGRVLAVDLSQRRLATARRRAKEQGLENLIEFIESDIEIMEFPSSKFNAILSKWGLMFVAHLERLLGRILDALVPNRGGGVFVAAVWSIPEKVPSMKIPSLVLDRLEVPPLRTAVNPFRLSDMSVLSKLFIEAGFEDVKTEAIPVTYRFDSAEDYFDFAYETSGSFKGRFTNAAAFLSDEKQDKIRSEIVNEATSFVDSKGQLSMSNETLLIAGHRGLH